LRRELAEWRAKVGDLESVRKSLQTENKMLAKQAEKATKSVRVMMPAKDYEESLAHYR
jgi:hypothetical protein